MVASVPTMSSTASAGPPISAVAAATSSTASWAPSPSASARRAGLVSTPTTRARRERPQQLDGERPQATDPDHDGGGAVAQPGHHAGHGVVAGGAGVGERPGDDGVQPAQRHDRPGSGGHDVRGQAAVAAVAPAGQPMRAGAVVAAAAGGALAARGRRHERHRVALGEPGDARTQGGDAPGDLVPERERHPPAEHVADLGGDPGHRRGRSGTARWRPPPPAPPRGPARGRAPRPAAAARSHSTMR